MVCSQNVSLTGFGAYTGEITAEHLLDSGIEWTLIGHSERRQYYGENDEVVAGKVKRCQEVGVNVILCIGENLSERESGVTLDVCAR